MNYSKFFTSELDKLKKEGLYRKFREIDRPIKKFPKADETQGDNERDVEVWCSNDVLDTLRIRKRLQNVTCESLRCPWLRFDHV